MATIDSLRREVRRLREQVSAPGDPKEWCLLLLDNEPVPEHIKAQISEQDSVFIRYINGTGMLEQDLMQVGGEWEPSIGHVVSLTGETTCLYRSGKELKIKQERTRRRRL